MDFPSTSALFGLNANAEFEEDVMKKSDLIEEEFNRQGSHLHVILQAAEVTRQNDVVDKNTTPVPHRLR